MAARFETVDGIVHMPNIPTEEVFTTPDPLRTEGVARSTKPLVLGGSIIRDLEVEFRGGRAVRIDASQNADVLRGYAAKDDGAARLGEVALVDGEGRIGATGTTFFDTLLDENAASHIALGSAYALCLDGEEDVRAHQPERHPRRLHDRLAGDDRHRRDDERRARAGARARRVGAVSARLLSRLAPAAIAAALAPVPGLAPRRRARSRRRS